jgi:hypothetical protein
MQDFSQRGGMESRYGGTMPNFEICYLDSDGSLACSFTAVCASETHAKVLAHAMKLRTYKKFEVWQDRKLVYQRPQLFESGKVLQ